MLIHLKEACKRFGGKQALNKVSMAFEKGYSYGLIGPNGSGKTTMLSLLSGYHQPSSGTITKIDVPFGSYVGMTGFFDHLTALEWLKFLSELCAFQDGDYLNEILDSVGLDPQNKTKIKNFSFGMRQRLGIASAIFNRPELILFDEPLNGLDPEGIIMFKKLIKREKKRNPDLCTIISSHRIDDLINFCDILIILNNGEVVFNDTTNIFRTYGADIDSAYLALTKS